MVISRLRNIYTQIGKRTQFSDVLFPNNLYNCNAMPYLLTEDLNFVENPSGNSSEYDDAYGYDYYDDYIFYDDYDLDTEPLDDLLEEPVGNQEPFRPGY